MTAVALVHLLFFLPKRHLGLQYLTDLFSLETHRHYIISIDSKISEGKAATVFPQEFIHLGICFLKNINAGMVAFGQAECICPMQFDKLSGCFLSMLA